LEERVEQSVRQLWKMREALLTLDPVGVREVLRELVTKIEVYFTTRQTAKQTRYRFDRGFIWIPQDKNPQVTKMVGGTGPVPNGSYWPLPRRDGCLTSSKGKSSARA